VSSLRAQAEAWREIDPDPETRAELDALLEAGDDDGLAERFGARLQQRVELRPRLRIGVDLPPRLGLRPQR